ncbi:MAG: phosphoribosylamine--glycine ligase, partial [Vicinamibacteria bacterium]
MKVLLIGSGGREHALAWKLSQSSRVKKIYCAPGNAGIGEITQRVAIRSHEIDKLLDFARSESVDLTVVGPEQPLVLGVVDRFESAGLRIFGPTRAAAQIEGSKAFAKNFMKKYKIPTAEYGIFTTLREAKAYVAKVKAPIVVKASGLAGGKGVAVCHTVEEALKALEQMMRDRILGEAGTRVVIEEYLEGEEVSFLALSDGENVIPLASS